MLKAIFGAIGNMILKAIEFALLLVVGFGFLTLVGKAGIHSWLTGQEAKTSVAAQAGVIKADAQAAAVQSSNCSRELIIRTQAEKTIRDVTATPAKPGDHMTSDEIGKVWGDVR